MSFGPPPVDMLSKDHYFDWSMLIYRTFGDVAPATVEQLMSAMKGKYGAKAKVHVDYGLDGRQRRTLTFYCGEIHNRADMQAYKQFVANLVGKLRVTCTLVYPT